MITETRLTNPIPLAKMKCVCHHRLFHDTLEISDGDTISKVHRILCPNCGLQMREGEPSTKTDIINKWNRTFNTRDTLQYAFSSDIFRTVVNGIVNGMLMAIYDPRNPDHNEAVKAQRAIAMLEYNFQHNTPVAAIDTAVEDMEMPDIKDVIVPTDDTDIDIDDIIDDVKDYDPENMPYIRLCGHDKKNKPLHMDFIHEITADFSVLATTAVKNVDFDSMIFESPTIGPIPAGVRKDVILGCEIKSNALLKFVRSYARQMSNKHPEMVFEVESKFQFGNDFENYKYINGECTPESKILMPAQ